METAGGAGVFGPIFTDWKAAKNSWLETEILFALLFHIGPFFTVCPLSEAPYMQKSNGRHVYFETMIYKMNKSHIKLIQMCSNKVDGWMDGT